MLGNNSGLQQSATMPTDSKHATGARDGLSARKLKGLCLHHIVYACGMPAQACRKEAVPVVNEKHCKRKVSKAHVHNIRTFLTSFIKLMKLLRARASPAVASWKWKPNSN